MSTSKEECGDIFDSPSICRLCLANDGANEYGSIYSEYDGVTIVRIIIDCIGLKVRKNDGLTQAICRKCCDGLVSIDKMRKQCIQSDKILRDLRGRKKTIAPNTFVDAGAAVSHHLSIQFNIERNTSEQNYADTNEAFLLSEDDEHLEKSILPVGINGKMDTPLDGEQCSRIQSIDLIEPKCDDDLPTDAASKLICCGCPTMAPFDSTDKLLAHRGEQHEKNRIFDKSIRPFECDTCYQRFLTETLLRHHKSRSNRTRAHICKSCGLGYFTNYALRRHEKVCRIVEKNFSCEECGKRFSQAITLKNHQKLHFAQKAYACPVCGKTFKKKFEISIHMVTHSIEQPYPCDHCPARFKRKQALKNHQRHHANARPYKCSLCEEWFNSFGARKYHRQTVHEGMDPFRCEQCGASYKRHVRLKQHMEKVHGVGWKKCDEDAKEQRDSTFADS